MFDICNILYNNVMKLATNVAIISIDVYSYIEYLIRRTYFNITTRGSMNTLCEDTNIVVFVKEDNIVENYKNVLEHMTPVQFLNILENYVANKDTPYKLIYIENYINNEHSRILCSPAMISKQDIDFILSPNIFNEYKIEQPFMNININTSNQNDKIENLNLKNPINYNYKHNEILSKEFIQYFINDKLVDDDYEIEILDNNCNFTNITPYQCVVLGDNDFYVLNR